eukprot:559711-Hanusia_phi.AAC.1
MGPAAAPSTTCAERNSVHDCCYWPGDAVLLRAFTLLTVPAGSDDICSVSMDKTMKIWNGADGSCLLTDGPGATVFACSLLPPSLLPSASSHPL